MSSRPASRLSTIRRLLENEKLGKRTPRRSFPSGIFSVSSSYAVPLPARNSRSSSGRKLMDDYPRTPRLVFGFRVWNFLMPFGSALKERSTDSSGPISGSSPPPGTSSLTIQSGALPASQRRLLGAPCRAILANTVGFPPDAGLHESPIVRLAGSGLLPPSCAV